MTRPDAELAAAIAAGDRQAFGELYDRYADRIYGFCLSLLRNRDDAADATQDTFLRAGERIGQLRDPSRVRSWLFAIARNESLTRSTRRQRTTADQDLTMLAADGPDLGAGVEAAELAALLWEAADGLADRDREVLALHLREGLDGPELAAVLDVKVSHVHVLTSRLRDRVEKAMGALLVARLGRDRCDDLALLLAGWDGRFSLDVRSRVTRHVEGCDRCRETRAGLLVPGRLVAFMPLPTAPVALRGQVLAAFDGTAPPRAEMAWRGDGFPVAPHAVSARRVSPLLAATAIMVAALLALTAGWLQFGDDGTALVATAPSSTLAVAPATTGATTTTAPSTSTTSASTTTEIVDPTTNPAEPATSSTDPTTRPTEPEPGVLTFDSTPIDFGDETITDTLLVRNDGGSAVVVSASTTGPFAVMPTGANVGPGKQVTLTVIVDRNGLPEGDFSAALAISSAGKSAEVPLTAAVEVPPWIARAGSRPVQITARGPGCPGGTTDLVVVATDDTGVATVTATWQGDSVELATVGSAFEATVGPFTSPGIVDFAIVVADTRGNETTGTAQLGVLPCS